MKKIWIITIALISILNTYAQEDEHIETDRPSETETPHTVKLRYIQLESGFHFERTSADSKAMAHPVSLIKYGITSWLELRLHLEYATLVEHYIPDDKVTTGIKPVEAGFKAALWEEKKWIPKTSFIFQTGIPTLASKNFREQHLAPEMRIAMKNSLNKTFIISYNAGAAWNGTETAPTWMYTFTPEIDISKHLFIFFEAYGYFKRNEPAEHTIDGGVEFFLNNNFTLDVVSGVGISKAAPDFYVGFGGSIRFR